METGSRKLCSCIVPTAFSLSCLEAATCWVTLHSWWWVEPEVAGGPVSSTAEQLETAAQPHQSISHTARQPPCKSTSHPSIHATRQSVSKLGMKLHYVILISN